MVKPKNTGIGKRIAEYRRALNMTQTELAHKMNCDSKTTINKVEMGYDNLSYERIERFAAALGVSPVKLCGWDTPQVAGYSQTDLRILNSYIRADKETKGMVERILNYSEGKNEN